jgi:hypothetical protein
MKGIVSSCLFGVIRVVLPPDDDFRFTPVNGHLQSRSACLKGARSRLMHRNKVTYSITSSARARKVCGISRPSALAVLRLRSGQPPDACNCPIVLRDGLPTEL